MKDTGLGPLQRATNRGAFAMLQASARLLEARVCRLMGKRYVERGIHDYRMILDLNDPGLSRALMLFREREIDMKIILERAVKPGMRIFDIGGNIGYYPLMELGLLAGSGELVVVEPVPQNVQLLRRNLELNRYVGVPVLEAAVSNVPTKKAFYISAYSNLGTFHPEGSASPMLTGDTLDVETLTVPMLASRFGPPDLMRMDIEGHEVEVLDGMLDDISKGLYSPTIVLETHVDRYGPQHDMAAVLEKLFALGYFVPIVSSGTDEDTDRIRRLGYTPGQRIATDAVYRTLFYDLRSDHAVDIICRSGGVRTVVLSSRHRWNA